MAEQPSGTVTLLFTDIEGSTRLLERLGQDRYAVALELHRRMLRDAFDAHGGYEVDYEGDAFFIAFGRAEDAVAAAMSAQMGLEAADWPDGQTVRVRMGVHTGEPIAVPPKYVGLDVHRGARIMAAGHGGQVLLSQSTRDLLGDGFAVRDLGEHRLKDLSAPQRLYQVVVDGLSQDFPPLRSLENRPTNLPTQLTPLIGREHELAELRDQIARADVRLLTLVGPGGTGKTRLALQLAAEVLEDYPEGVFFVGLATLADAALVLPTIAQTLGVREQPGETPAETLGEHLASKRVLLVLDNFEHVGDAAASVAQLLRATANADVIVTSRSPLHVTGEHEYPVPSLGLPDATNVEPQTVAHYEAVRLFIERAKAVKPDFQVTNENAPAVAEICARLDGLPLAIELAAARTRILPPEALLARLDQRLDLLTGGARDLPERQQTLRGAIDWSYSLLPPGEQALFYRLAVFVGGCTLEAAQTICNADGGVGIDVFDGIASLVEKSLLRQQAGSESEPRFSMLATIREYSLERLESSPDAETVRLAHADYFARLAERDDAERFGPTPGPRRAYAPLAGELANMREASVYALDRGESETAAWAVVGACRGLVARGSLREVLELSRAALASPVVGRPRGVLLLIACASRQSLGEPEAGTLFAEQALALGLETEDLELAALAASQLGLNLTLLGDFARAESSLEQAAGLADAAGADWMKVEAEVQRSNLLMVMHRYPEAGASFATTAEAWRRLGDAEATAHSLSNLAIARLHQGAIADAVEPACESALFYANDRVAIGSMYSLVLLASLLVARERYEPAASALAAAGAFEREMGFELEPVEAAMRVEAVAAVEGALSGDELERVARRAQSPMPFEAVEQAVAELRAGSGG